MVCAVAGQPDSRRRAAAAAPEGRRGRILPEDPLVRWVFWFIVFVSVGAPGIFALVLLVTQ